MKAITRQPSESERVADRQLMAENLFFLSEKALEMFQAHGRGALVVDTKRLIGTSHRVIYFTQEEMPEEPVELVRMVKQYDPGTQMVIHLLKTGQRCSTYVVGLESRHALN